MLLRVTGIGVVLVALSVGAPGWGAESESAALQSEPGPRRVLITNDDGIDAPGLAALQGTPSIAVSGGAPDALVDIAGWVVAMSRTPLVRDLRPFQYLTVDAPDGPVADIKGVKVVRRARNVFRFGVSRRDERAAGLDAWVTAGVTREPASPGTDVAALAEGYIVVTTMRADEQDLAHLRQLQDRVHELPRWRASRPEAQERGVTR